MTSSGMCERKADNGERRSTNGTAVDRQGWWNRTEEAGQRRKPLRPLADDGFARLDIMDTNKSMSKRHAIVSVDAQGNASVRDLKSTNGSFVVADNGQLMRLPADEDFKLPSTPMTLQFGHF